MTPSAFARTRIERLCEEALRRSGALGVLPTPLEAVLEAAGVGERVDLARIPGRPAFAERLLGAIWFEERALFVDRRQSEPRRRFTEAHEAVHLLCPWHAATLRLDTAAELFGTWSQGIEAEANYGAGQLIFQGGSFHVEALGCERSLRTPFALAARFGASRHAAAHHYVEAHPEPVALIVAGRWPGADGALPVWRSIESASFLRRFGRLAGCLPGGRLTALDGPRAPLAAAIDQARGSSEPAPATLRLADRGGRVRELRAEVFNNRHCHLVFVAEIGRLAAAA
jgi:hypothetical protein